MPDTLTRADPPTETNHRRLGKLTDQPWWTQADQAELDALLGEWVDGALEHKERCSICATGDVCAAVRDAWLIVWEFREQRIRVSQAQWLRACDTAAAMDKAEHLLNALTWVYESVEMPEQAEQRIRNAIMAATA